VSSTPATKSAGGRATGPGIKAVLVKRAFTLCIVVVLTAVDCTAGFAQSPSPTPQSVSTPAVQPAETEAPGVLIPGGTIIKVSLVEPVTSATAKEGDQVAIRVVKEVDVNGWLVIPSDSPGHATVVTVEQAGSNGHGGQLGITIDWVYSQDGGKIKLSTTNHASENGQQAGAASTATILSYVLLGPLGFFAHNFVRGRNVTIDTKQVFSVFVDRDVHVVTTAKATDPREGFDN
jgi:hypothetical protein